MSALLKSASGITVLPVARPTIADPTPDPRDMSIEAMRRDIAGLRAAAAQAEAATDARIAEASEHAARQARSEVRRDDAARIALLQQALAAAQDAFEDRLARLERLAPAVARVAIDRLFGASADRTAMVEAMIARRLDGFRREAVVAVAVSAADIEGAMLDDMGTRIGGVVVRQDPGLSSGQCRIDARFESMAFDLAGEWAVLAAALDAMAAGDGA